MSVPERSFEPEAGCPLDGVRVVDMSRLVSGNMVRPQLVDLPDDGLPTRPMRGSLPIMLQT